ncbi:hypothetical protein HN777_04045, partial [Candidatus Woesearchaeota archaeon]|nr:hypothetical protein [Candidatus Woesearchaeota archaeon]
MKYNHSIVIYVALLLAVIIAIPYMPTSTSVTGFTFSDIESEWENSITITAGTSAETIVETVTFGEYKSETCSEGIAVYTSDATQIQFETQNEVYENNLCTQVDIVFDNLIYEAPEEEPTPEEPVNETEETPEPEFEIPEPSEEELPSSSEPSEDIPSTEESTPNEVDSSESSDTIPESEAPEEEAPEPESEPEPTPEPSFEVTGAVSAFPEGEEAITYHIFYGAIPDEPTPEEPTNETEEEIEEPTPETPTEPEFEIPLPTNETINDTISPVNDTLNNTIQPINETNKTVNETLNETVEPTSNVTARVRTIQSNVTIFQPVIWQQVIELDQDTETLEFEVPEPATKIKVTKIRETGEEELIPDEHIEGIDLEDFDEFTIAANPENELPSSADEFSITGAVTSELLREQVIAFWNWFLDFFSGGITGFAVSEPQSESLEVPNKTITINETITQQEEIIIEYETPAPVTTEENTDFGKRVVVSSDVHYENILTYTTLEQQVPESAIKLYQIQEVEHFDNETNETTYTTERVDVTNNESIDLWMLDTDNDTQIDYLEWITPHLSNETFEIEILVLNPYTYLRDGETWTVAFNTSGTANLKISSPNANWTEIQTDLNETRDEMLFLNLTCADTDLANDLIIFDQYNQSYNYSQISENQSIKPNYFLIENYTCNETAYVSNLMNIAGYATLRFDFYNQTASVTDFAYDPQGANDTFTEGNDTDLDEHTSDSGHSWVTLWNVENAEGRVGGGDGFLETLVGDLGYNGGWISYLDYTPPTADYNVSLVITQPDSTDDYTILHGRMLDENNYYAYQTSYHFGKLYIAVDGVAEMINDECDTSGVDAGETVILEMVGTTVRVWIDGVNECEHTVTNLTAAGYAGIGMGASPYYSSDDASNQEVDDFIITYGFDPCAPSSDYELTDNVSCGNLLIADGIEINTSTFSYNVTGDADINGTLNASLGGDQEFGNLSTRDNGIYHATAQKTIIRDDLNNYASIIHNNGIFNFVDNPDDNANMFGDFTSGNNGSLYDVVVHKLSNGRVRVYVNMTIENELNITDGYIRPQSGEISDPFWTFGTASSAGQINMDMTNSIQFYLTGTDNFTIQSVSESYPVVMIGNDLRWSTWDDGGTTGTMNFKWVDYRPDITTSDGSDIAIMGDSSFGNLTINGSETLDTGAFVANTTGDLVVNGTFTASAGGDHSFGLIQINSGGTFSAPSGTTTVTKSGFESTGFDNDGTFTANSGTLTISGSTVGSANDFNGTSGNPYNLIINAGGTANLYYGSFTVDANLTISGSELEPSGITNDITVIEGVIVQSGGTLTSYLDVPASNGNHSFGFVEIQSGGTLDASNEITYINSETSGHFAFNCDGTYTHNNGELQFTLENTGSTTYADIVCGDGGTVYDLVLNDTSGTNTLYIASGNTHTISNDLIIENGEFNIDSVNYDIDVKGDVKVNANGIFGTTSGEPSSKNWTFGTLLIETGGQFESTNDSLNITASSGTCWDNNGTFTSNGGTVEFGGACDVYTRGTGTGQDFSNISFTGGSVYLYSNALDVDNDMLLNTGTLETEGQAVTVGGRADIVSGTFTGTSGATTLGSLAVSSGATYQTTSAVTTITASSGTCWDNNGTISLDSGPVIFSGGCNINTGGTAEANDFNDLNFTGGTSTLVSNNLNVLGGMDVYGGSLDANGQAINVLGTVFIDDNTLTGGTADHSFGVLYILSGGIYSATTGVTEINSSNVYNQVILLSSTGLITPNTGTFKIVSPGIEREIAPSTTGINFYNLDVNTTDLVVDTSGTPYLNIANDLNVTSGIFNTSYDDVYLNVTGDTIIANGATFIGYTYDQWFGSLTIESGGTYEASSATTTITSETAGGRAINNSGILTANSGTFNITTSGNTVIENETTGSGNLYNLVVDKTNELYTPSGMIIDNNLTVDAGVVYPQSNSWVWTVTGDVIINNGGTIGNGGLSGAASFGSLTINTGGTYSATTGTTTITSEDGSHYAFYNNGGTITHNLGIFNFTQTASEGAYSQIYDAGTGDLNNLVVGTTGSNQLRQIGALTIEGNLTSEASSEYAFGGSATRHLTVTQDVVIDGDINGGSNGASGTFGSLTINSGGTYSATSGTTTITSETEAGWALNNDGTYTHNDGTLTLDGPSTFFEPNSDPLYIVNSSGGTVQWASTPVTIESELYVDGGTFRSASDSRNLNVTGNVTVYSGGTLAHTGWTGAATFGSLTIKSGGDYRATSGTTTITSKSSTNYLIDNDGTLTANGGTINLTTTASGDKLLDFVGGEIANPYHVVIDGANTIQWNGNTAIDGNLTVNSNFQHYGATDTLTVLGNVTVNAILGAVPAWTGDASFGSLTINSGGEYDATPGTTTITSETDAGIAIDVDGTFTHNSGTVNITTTDSTLLDLTEYDGNINNLEINLGSSTRIAQSVPQVTIDGNLTVENSILSSHSGGTGREFNVTDDVVIHNNGVVDFAPSGTNADHLFGSLTVNSGGSYNATSGTTVITSEDDSGFAVNSGGTASRITHNTGTWNISNTTAVTSAILNAGTATSTEGITDVTITAGSIAQWDNGLKIYDDIWVYGNFTANSDADTLAVSDRIDVYSGGTVGDGSESGAWSFDDMYINTGSVLTATSGTTTISQEAYRHSSGTFNHNNGQVTRTQASGDWDGFNTAASAFYDLYNTGGYTMDGNTMWIINSLYTTSAGSWNTYYNSRLTFGNDSQSGSVSGDGVSDYTINIKYNNWIMGANAEYPAQIIKHYMGGNSDGSGYLYLNHTNFTLTLDTGGNTNTGGVKIYGNSTFGDITIDSPNNVYTYGDNISIEGVDINSGGTFDASGSDYLEIWGEHGSGRAIDCAGTFYGTGTTINFTSATSSAIDLVCSGGSLTNMVLAMSVGGNDFMEMLGGVVLTGNLTVEDGNFYTQSYNKNVTVTGDVVIDDGASLGRSGQIESGNFSFGSLTINSGGNYRATNATTTLTSQNGDYVSSGSGTYTHNNGLLKLTGSHTGNAYTALWGNSVYNLEVAVDDYVKLLDNPIYIQNDLNVTSGIAYRYANRGTYITGDVYVKSGGTFNCDDVTSNDFWVDDITIDSGGEYIASGYITTIDGDFSNSGTFTHYSGIMDMNGSSSTLEGEAEFYELRISGNITNDGDANYTIMNVTSVGNFTYNSSNFDDNATYYKHPDGYVGIASSSTLTSNHTYFNGTAEANQLEDNNLDTGNDGSYYVNVIEAGSTWTVSGYNSAPVVSDVDLLPITAYTTNTLSVYFNETDADADAITNITDWRLDNVSIAVLNMPFDTDISSGTVYDYTTYQTNGTIEGDPTWVADGLSGGAYEFDGSGDYINLGATNALIGDMPQNITISLWVNTTDTVAKYPLSLKRAAGGNSTLFSISSNYGSAGVLGFLTRDYANDSHDYLTYNGGYNDGNWHHVVAIVDGLDRYLYIDNVLRGSDSLGMQNATGNTDEAIIGGFGATSTGLDFTGHIDDVQIFNRSLTPNQVAEMYNAGADGHSVQNMSFNETARGQNWSVMVTPNDATLDGTAVESNYVVIANTAPDAFTNVVLAADNSSLNNTYQNLTVTWTESSDDDSDTITNITDWRLNSSSIAVLNMPFDSNRSGQSGAIVRDYSTNTNNGTFSSAPIWNATGKIGGAYEFDGVDDYINISDDASLEKQDNMTVTAWVNIEGRSGSGNEEYGRIIFKVDSSGSDYQIFHTNQDPYTFRVRVDSDGNQTSTTYNYGNWHHVAMVINNSVFTEFYVDSVLQSMVTGAAGIGTGDNNLYIGNWRSTSDNRYFNGTIDEVQIYNRSLTANQILQIYTDGAAGHSVQNMSFNETYLNDTWTVALTPNDGLDDGTTTTSNAVETVNTAPVITTVDVTPDSPTTDDDLTCTVTAGTDADGESLTYTYDWYKDDVWVFSESGAGTTSTVERQNLTNQDVWNCSVTPNDGIENGTNVSDSVTVAQGCVIDMNATLTANLACTTLYVTGSNTLTTSTYTLSATGITEINGTIDATSSTGITFDEIGIVTGGTYLATTATTKITDDSSINGTFTHNDGLVNQTGGYFNYLSSTTPTFYDLEINTGYIRGSFNCINEFRVGSGTVRLYDGLIYTFGNDSQSGSIITGTSGFNPTETSGAGVEPKIYAANQIYPVQISGTEWNWDASASRTIYLKWVDFNIDITTGASNAITIVLDGDSEFNAFTISSGDTLNLNGQRVEFDGAITNSGTIAMANSLVYVNSGNPNWDGSSGVSGQSTSDIVFTGTFSAMPDDSHRTIFVNTAGTVTLNTDYFFNYGQVIVGAGELDTGSDRKIGSVSSPVDNLTIATGGTLDAHASNIFVNENWKATGGLIGKSALDLDGNDQYVDVGADESLNLSNDFTVEAWVQADGPGEIVDTSGGIISWGEQSAGKRRSLMIWNGGSGSEYYLWFSGYGTAANLDSGVSFTDGKWHHVVSTVDSSNFVKIYVDGKLMNSSTLTLLDYDSSDTNIGRTQYPEYFNGSIGKVAIWNGTLTESEIRSNMFADCAGNSNQSVLVSCYQFDEGTGTSVADSIGSNTGTASGSGVWAGAGTFTYGTSTINMTGTGNFTYPASEAVYNLELAQSGQTTTFDNIADREDLDIFGTLTSGSGTIVGKTTGHRADLFIRGDFNPVDGGSLFNDVYSVTYQTGDANISSSTYGYLFSEDVTRYLAGNVTVDETLLINSGAVITDGYNITTEVVTATGDLNLTAGSVLTFEDIASTGFGSSAGEFHAIGEDGNLVGVHSAGTNDWDIDPDTTTTTWSYANVSYGENTGASTIIVYDGVDYGNNEPEGMWVFSATPTPDPCLFAGNATLTANITCSTFQVESGATVVTDVYSINATGEADVNGTLNASLGGDQWLGSIRINGGGMYHATSEVTTITSEDSSGYAFRHNGDFLHNNGIVNFTISVGTSIDAVGTSGNFYNLIFSGTSTTLLTDLDVEGNLTENSVGALVTNANNKYINVTGDVVIGGQIGDATETADWTFNSITINSGGIYSATQGITHITGESVDGVAFSNTGTFTHNDGTINISTQAVTWCSNTYVTAGNVFYNLITSTSGTCAFGDASSTRTQTIENEFNITSGTVSIAEDDEYIQIKNLNILGGELDSSYLTSDIGLFNISGDVIVYSGGTLDTSNGGDHNIGSLTINSGGTYDASNETTTMNGNLINYGTFTDNSGAVDFDNNATIVGFDTQDLSNLSVSSPAYVTHKGNLTVTDGILVEGELDSKAAGGLEFDGTDDNITVPEDVFELQIFTMSAWVNIKDTNQNPIFGNANSQLYYGYHFRVNADTPNVSFSSTTFNGAALDKVESTTTLNTDEWHHVAVTLSGSQIDMYVDGVLEGSDTSQQTLVYDTTMYPMIGEDTVRSGYEDNFNGQISDFRIYNTSLNSSQIEQIYNASFEDQTNLIAQWKLDDATGTSAADSSTQVNDGTLNGGPVWFNPDVNIGALTMPATGIYHATSGTTTVTSSTTRPINFVNGATFNHNNGTFSFTNSGDDSFVTGTSYHNFYDLSIINGGLGSDTIFYRINVDNDLTVTSSDVQFFYDGAVLGDVVIGSSGMIHNTVLNSDVSFGSLTINSGGEYQCGSGTTTINSSLSNSGTFTHNSGTTTFNNDTIAQVTGNATFYNLNTNSAIFNSSDDNITIASGGTLTQGGNITAYVLSIAGTMNTGAGEVVTFDDSPQAGFEGTGTLTIAGADGNLANITNAGTTEWTMPHPTLNSTWDYVAVSYGNNTGTEAIIVYDGSDELNNVDVGEWIFSGITPAANCTFSANSTLTANLTCSKLDVLAAATVVTDTYSINATSDAEVNGTLNASLGGGQWFGSMTINSGGVYAATAGTTTVNAGVINNAGTFTHNSGTLTHEHSGGVPSITWSGSGNPYNLIVTGPTGNDFIDWNTNGFTIDNDLTITDIKFRAATTSYALTVTGDVIINSGGTDGTLSARSGSQAISLGSLTINSGGTYDATSGTTTITSETLTGYGIQSSAGTFTHNNGNILVTSPSPRIEGDEFYDIEIRSSTGGLVYYPYFGNNPTNVHNVLVSNGTMELTARPISASGDLSIESGSSVTTSSTTIGLTVAGDVEVNGTLGDGDETVAWTFGSLTINSGGTYDATSGTTTMNGNFINYGTFNNNTGTVKFQQNATVIGVEESFADLNITNAAYVTHKGNLSVDNDVNIVSGTLDSKAAGGLEFDATNDYVNIGNDTSIQSPLNFTISGWFKANALVNFNTIYNDAGNVPSAYDGRDIRILNNKLNSGTYNYGTNNAVNSRVLTIGQWYHFAIIRQGDTNYMYINGILDDSNTTASSYTPSGDDGCIGRYNISGTDGGYFNGTISDVRIYNSSLSAAEVGQLYNQTFTDTTNLAGQWKLNDATGSTAADSSGNGNTGTLEGNPVWFNPDVDVGDDIIILSGSTYTATAGTTAVTDAVSVTGTYDSTANGTDILGSLTIASGGTYSATSGVTEINNNGNGAYAVNNDGTLTANAGTINITTAVGTTFVDFATGSGNPYNLIIDTGSGTNIVKWVFDSNIIDNDLTINSGEFQPNGYTYDIVVTGDTIINSGGTLGLVSWSDTASFGSLTINSGGTYEATTGTTTITNYFSNAGTLAHNSGTITFNNDTLAQITGNTTFYNLNTNAAVFNASDDNITIDTSGTLTQNGNITAWVLNIAGTMATGAGEKVTFDDSANAGFEGTGTLTIAGSDGNLANITNAGTTEWTMPHPTLNSSWDYVAVSYGNNTGTSAIIVYDGTDEGNNVPTPGWWIFTSSPTPSNCTFNGTTTLTANLTCANLDVLAGGNLATSTYSINATGAAEVNGTLNASQGGDQWFGSMTIQSGGTHEATSGTTNVTGNVIVTGTYDSTANGTDTFGYLKTNSGGVYRATGGTTTITDESSNYAVWIGDSSTFSANGGTINIITQDETYLYIRNSASFYDLILDTSANFYFANNIVVANDLNVTSGTIMTVTGTYTKTVTGDVIINGGQLGRAAESGARSFGSLTINSGGTYYATSGTTTLTNESGSGFAYIRNGGTYTHNSGTMKVTTPTVTILYDASGSGNLYNLIVNTSTDNTILWRKSGYIIDNDLTINSGIFGAFDGNDDLTVTGDVDVIGTLLGATSEMSMGSLIINSGGNYSATSGTTTINSSLSNAGTYTHNSGTTTFNNDTVAQITGNTTFYSLNTNSAVFNSSDDNITIASGGTLTQNGNITAFVLNILGTMATGAGEKVTFDDSPQAGFEGTGALNIAGSSGNLANITNAGTTEWTMPHPTLNSTWDYVAVSYGNNTGTEAIIVYEGADEGNNVDDGEWIFSFAAAPANCSFAANTTLTANLTCSKLDVLAAATVVTDTYSINATSDAEVNGTLNASLGGGQWFGSMTINSGGTHEATSGTTTVNAGVINNAGTFTHNSGTLTHEHSGGVPSITWSGSGNPYNLIVTGPTGNDFIDWNTNGFTIDNDLTITDIKFRAATTSYTLTVTGDVIINSGGTDGTLSARNGAQAITLGSLTINSGGTYSATSGTTTITDTNGAFVVYNVGTMTHNNGLLLINNSGAGGQALLIGIATSTNGVYDLQITDSGTDSRWYNSAKVWNDITIDAGATFKQYGSNYNIEAVGDVSVSGTLGEASWNDSATFGSLTINSGGTYSATIGTTTISGNFDNDGTFTHNNGLVNFDDASTHTTLTGDTETTFYNLLASDDTYVNPQIRVNTTVINNINNTGGYIELDGTSQDVILTLGNASQSGTLAASGTIFRLTDNTVNYVKIQGADSSYPAIITGTPDWDKGDYNSLVHLENVDIQTDQTTGGTNVIITLDGDNEFDAFTISSGDTLNLNGQTATISGNLANEGTFTGDEGNLTLTGTQNMNGTINNVTQMNVSSTSDLTVQAGTNVS